VFEIKINRTYLYTYEPQHHHHHHHRHIVLLSIYTTVVDRLISAAYYVYQRYLCGIKKKKQTHKINPDKYLARAFSILTMCVCVCVLRYKGGSALVTIETSLRAYTSSPRTNLKWWSTKSRDIMCVCDFARFV